MMSLETEMELECAQLEHEVARLGETERLLASQIETQTQDMRELHSMTSYSQQYLTSLLAAQGGNSSFEFERQKGLAIARCERHLAEMARREVKAMVQRFPEHGTYPPNADVAEVLEQTVDSAMQVTMKLELEVMEKKMQLASQIEETESMRREIEQLEALIHQPAPDVFFDDPM